MGSIRRRYRQLFAALIGVSAVAVPTALLQIGGGSPASASSADTITYVQTSGAKGTYLQFKSADGSTTVNQSITSGGGGCSNPTVKSTTPLVAFSAHEYPNGYGSAPASNPNPASVGAYQQRTGVCFTPQAWSIENLEGLDFAVGTYPTYAAGRTFSRAQLVLERWSDKTGLANVTAQLTEWLGGTQVGEQDCVLGAPNTTIVADTDLSIANPTCTADTPNWPSDPATTGFDTIEVRELTPGGSISVVGPTSTFTLENQICGGQHITTTSTDGISTTGQVTATLTMTGTSSQCKSYSGFSANADNADGSRSVEFDSASITGVPFTVDVTWGEFYPQCAPEDNGSGMPVCPLTEFKLNGQTVFSTETFCSTATADDPLCTTQRNYSYFTDPNTGLDVTQVTEKWSGLADWIGKS